MVCWSSFGRYALLVKKNAGFFFLDFSSEV
jgi:hypothetical protein